MAKDDVYRAIISKRDTRAYEARPIPAAILARILNAGRMAGSSHNGQPCRLIVMEDRARIADLARCGQYTAPLAMAPLVVVIALQRGARPFDAGRVGQNLMLAAWAEGITSCPVGIQDEACGSASLGLPADFEVAMAIAFGYPEGGRVVARGEPRLPLTALVFRERWGQVEA